MDNNTTTKAGKSFLSLKNHSHIVHPQFRSRWVKEDSTITVIDKQVTTAAQAMTLIGYSSTCRSLDYRVKCEDFNDLKACINIIESYNDFDAALIVKKAFWYLALHHFVNSDNPNNGKDLFDFHIAREYSPAFYVGYNGKYNNRQIVDTETIQNNDEPDKAGTEIFWGEYSEQDFRENMEKLAKQINADEFSIKESFTYDTGEKHLTARFWWD